MRLVPVALLLAGCSGAPAPPPLPDPDPTAKVAAPQPLPSARVVAVQDGDTLIVLDRGQRIIIRLAEIDAPEKRQPYGAESKAALAALCLEREARLAPQATDRYGRTVARVWCDGVDAGRAQIERGLAWVYLHYARDLTLLDAQTDARRARAGLWAQPAPQPPWEFRRH